MAREGNSPRVSSDVSQTPAQMVGNHFVSEFYKTLNQSPQDAHKFYHENSKLGRPNDHGYINSVTTLRAINEKILATVFKDVAEDIKSVDVQESLNGGGIVLVTGSLTGKDKFQNDFTQLFFLAPQENGYFILNDIFRHVDDNGYWRRRVALTNPKNKSPSQWKSKRVSAQGSSLVSYQSIPAGSQLTAQVVGNAFVHHYYRHMNQSPQFVYQFYKEYSKLGRAGPHGVMNTATTIKAINEKILAMGYSELKAVIKTVDAQESLDGGIIVFVAGYLTWKYMVKKNFVQSFFLAPQEKGYFILNDIFRCVDNIPNPAHSPISEDMQVSVAIIASIHSAVAEAVPIDLNKLDIIRKPKTKDPNNGSCNTGTTSSSCVICWAAPKDGACIPCGHMAACMSCLNKIKCRNMGCPVCRAKIDLVVKIYA